MTKANHMKSDSRGQLPPAETLRLAELADYAEGSIVSRTLVKNPSGTVTLFAFAQGEDLSEHTSPFDALVFVLDGTAELIIGGKSVRAGVGEVVLMPASVPHAVRAPEQFKMLLVMVRG